jgi:glycine cleavage system protein P-like pyridoxal-binding family
MSCDNLNLAIYKLAATFHGGGGGGGGPVVILVCKLNRINILEGGGW